MEYDVRLDEGQRQLVLMAMAWLSLQRQGWDHALNEIALKLDNEYVMDGEFVDGSPRSKSYDDFRSLRLEGLMQAIDGKR